MPVKGATIAMLGLAAWGALASLQWYRWRDEATFRRDVLEGKTGIPAMGYDQRLYVCDDATQTCAYSADRLPPDRAGSVLGVRIPWA